MNVQAVVVEDVNKIKFGEYAIREPYNNEVLVKVLYSGISPGTELRCISGKEPNASKFPMITGYSLAGIVVKGAGKFKEGDKVFLPGSQVTPDGIHNNWGGHISYAISIPDKVFKLPEDINLREACLLAMVAIAMHGVVRSKPLVGDRVFISGAGLIGSLAAMLYKLAGAEVVVADPNRYRRELIRRCGIDYVIKPADDFHSRLLTDFPDGFDIVVDASGIPSVLESNLKLLRSKSTSWEYPQSSPKVVILASYGANRISFDYQETLFNKETEIITSRAYLREDIERAIRVVGQRRIKLGELIGIEADAKDADKVFERLKTSADIITACLRWNQ